MVEPVLCMRADGTFCAVRQKGPDN
jgi:hypothetical protein